MKKNFYKLITILLTIGLMLSTPASGLAMPENITLKISEQFVELSPIPQTIKVTFIEENYKLYTFPETFADVATFCTSSSIELIAYYPITLLTPTAYIATTTTNSLIIGPPDILEEILHTKANEKNNTETASGTQTSTNGNTSTQTITATPQISIKQIQDIPPEKLSYMFFFLSSNELTKIILAYNKLHQINTPTSTLKSIAESTAKWSKIFGIDPLLLLAQIRWESKFNPQAISKSGAKGLMQLKDFVYQPAANLLGLATSSAAIFDIDNNIAAGTYYLYNKIRTWGTEKGALGAYLLGDTGLLKALWEENDGKDSIGTPYQQYIEKIMNTRNELRSYIGLSPYNEQLSVYLSPGHGTFDENYYDTGAIVGKYRESEINLAISLKLKSILEANGIKVYIARTKEQDPHTPYLSQRVRMINTLHPNVVISIHANANPYSSSIRGYEIYYRKGYDRFLAKAIDKALQNISPIPKHKDPQYMKLIILSGWPPSVLIETGYMTNDNDLHMLIDDQYQWSIAASIAKGVLIFLGKNPH